MLNMIDLPVFGGIREFPSVFRLCSWWEGEGPRCVLSLPVGLLKCQPLRDVNAAYIRLYRVWLILF